MDRFVLIIVGLITIGVIGGILFTQKSLAQPSFAVDDPSRPSAVLEPLEVDLGRVGLKEVKTTEATITNSGRSPLVLTDPVTSCGCTSVTLTIAGEVSPEFSMHGNPSWEGILPEGESATLTVIFDPKAHNISGDVSRAVNITTNDPVQPKLTFSFKADVR